MLSERTLMAAHGAAADEDECAVFHPVCARYRCTAAHQMLWLLSRKPLARTRDHVWSFARKRPVLCARIIYIIDPKNGDDTADMCTPSTAHMGQILHDYSAQDNVRRNGIPHGNCARVDGIPPMGGIDASSSALRNVSTVQHAYQKQQNNHQIHISIYANSQ